MSLKQPQIPGVDIRYIDPIMSPEQIDKAIRYIYESHSRHPITKPIAIHLTKSGSFTVVEGNVAGMSALEVAARFDQQLQVGNEHALRLNQLLSEGGASA